MIAIPSVDDAEKQPLQASKWLKLQMLIGPEEMGSLFEALSPFFIIRTGTVCTDPEVGHDQFLSGYRSYAESLMRGELPGPAAYRPLFSTVFTRSADVLYSIDAGEGRQIVRLRRPAVQLQAHMMNYSAVDGQFRAMALGSGSISWGIQFTYPQIFQDLSTHQVCKVDDSPQFPNTALFRSLQQWTRRNTAPTPMIVEERQVNIPMRLGKEAFGWINNHPQLKEKLMHVRTH